MKISKSLIEDILKVANQTSKSIDFQFTDENDVENKEETDKVRTIVKNSESILEPPNFMFPNFLRVKQNFTITKDSEFPAQSLHGKIGDWAIIQQAGTSTFIVDTMSTNDFYDKLINLDNNFLEIETFEQENKPFLTLFKKKPEQTKLVLQQIHETFYDYENFFKTIVLKMEKL